MEFGSAEAFDRQGTLGVEEEFFVVDERGRPTSGTDELVYGGDPPELLAGRLDHELFKCVIETQTPTCESLAEADETFRRVRDALVAYAEREGFGIAGAGLHPLAIWRELEHADKSRYREQLDRIQYPQHRNTTAGLHVHVGVDDADAATWIANELRWHLPLMLALSANSPYWNGFDTGLASARAKIFEGLPNTGMPTSFVGFDEYADFERRMVETGSISDRGELWYDVRPHTGHGTVEVRTPDGQHDPDRVFALVEYTAALVEAYAEQYADASDPWAVYESTGNGPVAGAVGHDHRRELLDENKWRALRHGHDAALFDRRFEDAVPLGELVDREASRLGVSGIVDLYDAESGAARQRRLHADGADALCGSLRL